MPVPFACPVRLTDDERQRLESLARAQSTPQALAFRCRLRNGCKITFQCTRTEGLPSSAILGGPSQRRSAWVFCRLRSRSVLLHSVYLRPGPGPRAPAASSSFGSIPVRCVKHHTGRPARLGSRGETGGVRSACPSSQTQERGRRGSGRPGR